MPLPPLLRLLLSPRQRFHCRQQAVQLRGAAQALFGLAGQAVQHDPVERRGDGIRGPLRRRNRIVPQPHGHHLKEVVRFEDQLPGEEVVGHAAGGVDVGAAVDRLAEAHLRRHVGRCAGRQRHVGGQRRQRILHGGHRVAAFLEQRRDLLPADRVGKGSMHEEDARLRAAVERRDFLLDGIFLRGAGGTGVARIERNNRKQGDSAEAAGRQGFVDDVHGRLLCLNPYRAEYAPIPGHMWLSAHKDVLDRKLKRCGQSDTYKAKRKAW